MQVSSLLSDEPVKPAKQPVAKTVSFELLLDDSSKTKARIPLRILINPHDTTESIITTVKNFYGIYDGHGVTFEDVDGSILIAQYENLRNNTTVYVRTVAVPSQPLPAFIHTQFHNGIASDNQRRSSLGEPFQMLPPQVYEQTRSPSRPSSRLARKRSTSPSYGRGRRSASQQKAHSMSAVSRGSSANGSFNEDGPNGYSDSEAGRSSIAGSKKARSEQFASAEISLDNVLQDGRRKKILFESSELPLFVPPQVPITTSTSSVSPQRRSLPQENPSPFQLPAVKLTAQQPPALLSPRSQEMNNGTLGGQIQTNTPQSMTPLPPHGHRLRDRSAAQPASFPASGKVGFAAPGILPTPDPTVASCISDEDVARQLMSLGDASNFSRGRTSNSTVDDAFSGAAEASSTGATSDSDEYSDEDAQYAKNRISDYEDDEYTRNPYIKNEFDEYDDEPKTKKIKTKMHDGPSSQHRLAKPPQGSKGKMIKARSNTFPKAAKPPHYLDLAKPPTAPSAPGQLRKVSAPLSFQHQLAADEEDLSSKPRCQRCRKSKKGCDRQRPCQRCKDAGIGVEGCISEDEGNGRKGRYGRHMGVPIKKTIEVVATDTDSQMAGTILSGMAVGQLTSEKSKKRKR